MINRRKYTDKELNTLLNSMVVLIDTREKQNSHITGYFDKHGIAYKKKALPAGDYSVMLPKNEELGIDADMWFYEDILVERKHSLDELENNFSKERERFNNEFSRMKADRRYLIIENGTYADVFNGNYGKYHDKDKKPFYSTSYIGSLHSFNTKYNLQIIFMPDPYYTPIYMFGIFRYYLRFLLE